MQKRERARVGCNVEGCKRITLRDYCDVHVHGVLGELLARGTERAKWVFGGSYIRTQSSEKT